MERFTVVMPLEDKARRTSLFGAWGRCVTWNFVDEWQLFTQGLGLPPRPRELWLSTDASFQKTKSLLVAEAKKVREELLNGLMGIPDGIDINKEEEIDRKDIYEEQMAQVRKSGLIILPGGQVPPWRGKQ
mgnify:CR=1 FL=1